jgi:hypothetical protein
VNIVQLGGLSCSPQILAPSTQWAVSTCTVTLSSAAPNGGEAIALTASSAAARAPQTVTVPAAANSATFSVTAGAVATPTATTLTASSAGVSASINLTIEPGWFTTGGTWTDRKPVTIDHTHVFGTSALQSFPMLFSVTDPDLRIVANGGSVATASGQDILFTASDGLTKLNHEVESYNPATGQLVAWVNIPSLSPAADTGIYVYFGHASAPVEQKPAAVWDSNFEGVWHFPNGTVLSTKDSTANANNGLNTGATATAGLIGGAASFNGTSSQIGIDSIAKSLQAGDITFSLWINLSANYSTGMEYQTLLRLGDNASNNDVILSLGDHSIGNPDGALHLLVCNSSNCGQAATTQNSWSAHTWYYLVGAYSAASGLKLYVNGVLAASNPAVTSRGSAYATYAAVGAWTTGVTNVDYFRGTVDETRISNSARSAAWIGTEYANQNSPASFVSLGQLQRAQ